jgi:hypothetical protein
LFVVKNDSSDEINMENLMGKGEGAEEMLQKVYKNPIYKKAVRAWLPFLNKRGFLDTMIVEPTTSQTSVQQNGLTKSDEQK